MYNLAKPNDPPSVITDTLPTSISISFISATKSAIP